MEPILSAPGEEQRFQITVVYRTKHNPGNNCHLKQLSSQILKDKYQLNDNNEVWI